MVAVAQHKGQEPSVWAIGEMTHPAASLALLWAAYRLRLRRRSLLVRAIRKRRELAAAANRTKLIRTGDILCFASVRNERDRLPYFVAHHRGIGVDHFLFVDNGSTDGTKEFLQDQPDVSVWSTGSSYKAGRFGMDWLTWLQFRHGHGHWCLTLDADEILIYPYWETRPLRALTALLDAHCRESFGALTVDMYPEGSVSTAEHDPQGTPFDSLCWFDSGNYIVQVQPKLRNLWIQGGARARAFFADAPRRAPTLNKTPLVRWNRRYVYLNSTHSLLPAKLNQVYEVNGGEALSGVLLHTKFLPTIIPRSQTEQARAEHFADATQYKAYYDRLVADPVLHCAASTRFTGWRQMEALGMMSRGGWL